MDNLTSLMESLVASQNQPPSVQPTRVTTEAPTVPVSVTPTVGSESHASRLSKGNARELCA